MRSGGGDLDHADIVAALLDSDHPQFDEINAWYRAEQARETVRKAVSAMEMGLLKVNFAFFADAFSPKPGQKQIPGASLLYNWGMAGYLDVDYNPYPAFYTYRIVIEKLTNARFVKRLSLGAGIHGFEFSSKGNPFHVLWSDKDATVDLTLDPHLKAAKVTHIVTEFDQQDPRTEMKELEDGKVELDLTQDPLFVEPDDETPNGLDGAPANLAATP